MPRITTSRTRRAAALTAAGAAALVSSPPPPPRPTAPCSTRSAGSRPVTPRGPRPPSPRCARTSSPTSGTQPLYDWNEVNIANADGNHRALIPDGKLCSANREKYRALDWARTDWPATAVSPGPFGFKVRVTAPHSGTMTMYITKQGFDPTQPLKWSDLDSTPAAVYATTRTSTDGYYAFNGTLPSRTGRHIVYMVWQRNDSPEAFYSCSDVTFGTAAATAGTATAARTTAEAPTEAEIADGAALSTVSHAGHGGDEQPPALSAESAATPASPLPLALAGAGALAAFGAGSVLVARRRNEG
ncbi:lytic polysaccharide monooxygenase [Streptomyces sp. SBR177]